MTEKTLIVSGFVGFGVTLILFWGIRKEGAGVGEWFVRMVL